MAMLDLTPEDVSIILGWLVVYEAERGLDAIGDDELPVIASLGAGANTEDGEYIAELFRRRDEARRWQADREAFASRRATQPYSDDELLGIVRRGDWPERGFSPMERVVWRTLPVAVRLEALAAHVASAEKALRRMKSARAAAVRRRRDALAAAADASDPRKQRSARFALAAYACRAYDWTALPGGMLQPGPREFEVLLAEAEGRELPQPEHRITAFRRMVRDLLVEGR